MTSTDYLEMFTPEELSEMISGIFKEEMSRELLLTVNPDTTDDLVKDVLAISDNPWDSVTIHKLLELKSES